MGTFIAKRCQSMNFIIVLLLNHKGSTGVTLCESCRSLRSDCGTEDMLDIHLTGILPGSTCAQHVVSDVFKIVYSGTSLLVHDLEVHL